MNIQQGHFGDVRLDGLKFCATVDFPGPLHEETARFRQLSKSATAGPAGGAVRHPVRPEPGGRNLFHIFSLIVSKMLDPIFAN